MSKLEELIQQYCPDGVEYVKIGEIAQVGTGSSNGNEAIEDGIYPFVRSQIIKKKDTYEYDEEAIIIPGEGGIGDIFHYINGKYALHQRVYRIHFISPHINVKFAFYYMKSAFKKFIMAKAVSSTVSSIRKPMIEGFSLPIPPLPVQEEIVRILDTFTELQAELQAELQKRKQQYNYYRDNLLAFEDKKDIQWKHLGDICDIKGRIGFRGYTREDQVKEGEGALSLSPSNIQDGQMEYSKGTYITWSKYDESPEIKTYNGDIIFCKTASVGKVAVVKNLPYKATINPQLVVLKNIQCSASFLAYVLETNSIQSKVISMAGVGSVPNISQKALSDIYIPIPSLYEQQRIVDILDMFNALANDLAAGLPAEIEKRRLQYEYYRDKLLTFKRK